MFYYSFSAIKGRQGRNDYYIAMLPLVVLSKIFVEDLEYVSPEFRAQRQLNDKRLPAIKNYILDNLDNYVFTALAASIDGEFNFSSHETTPDIGILKISSNARILINDGQHRKAAILMALEESSELQDETISVVFYKDQGLKRSQQIFTDLNKHAVKVPNSIAELYDSRNEVAVVTRNVVKKIPFLNRYTDKENDNLGKYSSCLFTLNTFCKANKRILKKSEKLLEDERFLIEYWSCIIENIPLWRELEDKEITKTELRNRYIVCQAIVIKAFGYIGNYFYEKGIWDFHNNLSTLSEVDWSRNATHWHLRNINEKGKVIANETSIMLTSNYIKKCLLIPLNEIETQKEIEYKKVQINENETRKR